ncbi:MAG: efflux RND transporter permease subunit [Candidatus Kapabacteria bacterium]|nr:efflux RND transporter permease subunit [Ignavibacteriota bacterium]MCW5884543.1 efflux RND transporter permease subunit [Candidatus Kapabacteria bacterium]
MKSLLTYFIKYPVWAYVVKILILLFGFLALMNMKTSFFSELDSNMISISIIYPGASPEEIEQGVIQKIEDNLKGIQGIDRYSSNSRENIGSMGIEVFRSYNTDEVLLDVKNAVDRINSFPVGMEPPVVAKAPAVEFAISFGIFGIDDLNSLKSISKRVEDDLRSIPGLSQVTISGYPAENIVAYVNEFAMRSYDITFDDITRALRTANIELTAGSVKTDDEEILIRMKQKNYYAEGLQDIVVKSMQDGRLVRLRDVARIDNSWEESPNKSYINGKRAVIFNVNKIKGENILDITAAAKKYVEDFNKKNTDYQAIVIDDFTESLTKRIDTLLTNGSQGAILVILGLALFLNLRLALWVALSIPFSFMGMFLIGYMTGITINVISLFGCIVVVGILVDDGVVIAEQIYQNYEKGMKPFKAAINGVMEVLPSVVFSVLTTVAMFTPFFFMDGRSGAGMKDMGFVVIFALIFSLIEAALILPAHLAHSKALRERKHNKIRLFLDSLLTYPRDVLYKKSLNFLIDHKLIALAIMFSLTIITVGGFAGGHIKFTFFPFIDGDNFEVKLSLPAGTREGITEEIADRIERAVWEVNEELTANREDKKQVITTVVKNIGTGPASFRGPMGVVSDAGNSNDATLKVILLNGEERNLESFKISNLIREKVGPIYEAETLLFGGGSIFGKAISISLLSPDLEDLDAVKNYLKDELSNISEIANVSDNDVLGLREINIKLKEKAFLLGLSNFEVARQVRQGFFGDEVQRLQRGNDEIKVWVKYSPEDRSTIRNWEDMRIKLPNGNSYPLTEIADYSIKRGKTVINHIDGKREITIEADMVDQNAEVPPVLERINTEFLMPVLAKYPSVSQTESGQKREVMKMASTARTGLSIAFIMMFFLIVLSFRSFSQAFIVLALLPLGIIGAVWGHYFQSTPVNIMSIYGMIALIGVIVNNSIVYINTFNGYLKAGMSYREALVGSGINRFRPILLTTGTTVLGLLPLLAEKSLQAKFLIPMAISVAYGLMIGSFFVLVFLPVLLVFLNDFKRLAAWIWTGKKPEREELEPAVKEELRIKYYLD